jgi:haloacid dehalogenase superfamily, subfamily IA, variant 1 with third motif having Dx(3-4)D or Dx(3-4)E
LLNGVQAIAFDLDGTIYFGSKVVEGAVETVRYFADQEIKIVYFTNNSGSTREQIYAKLRNMGFELHLSDVYTSGYACALYAARQGLAQVYCMGSEGLKREMQKQGITTSNQTDNVDAIIVGLDKDFNYDKLARALNIWRNGVKAIACNRDRAYPIENGILMPGCGAIVAALETAKGKSVDEVIGKPNTFMLEIITQHLQVEPTSILVVGDTEESDIEMARRFGCPSVLIGTRTNTSESGQVIINKLSELPGIISIQENKQR